MKDKRYKVYNKNSFHVGIKLDNPYREQNIRNGSFAMLTMDDIAFIDTTSSLFKRGMLTVDDVEVFETLGLDPQNNNVMTDDEIRELLKGNITTMKNRLSTITEIYVKNRIYTLVKEIGDNLSVAKIKFLKSFIGRELFLEEIK